MSRTPTHSLTRRDTTTGERTTFYRDLAIPGSPGDVTTMGTFRGLVLSATRRTAYWTATLSGGAAGTNGTMNYAEVSDPLIPEVTWDELWLIGCGGQSNGASQATEAPAITVPSVANASRIHAYRCSGEWTAATEPLHMTTQCQEAFYASFNGATPGTSSHIYMADRLLSTHPTLIANPGIHIGLVPWSVGGRYAAEFFPDTTRSSYGGAAVARMRHALRRAGAVYWFTDIYQGEADSKVDGLGSGWAAQWQANLADFATRIPVAELRVLATILSTDNPDAVTYTKWELVRASQAAQEGVTSGAVTWATIQAPTLAGGDPVTGAVHQKTSKQLEHGANKAAKIITLGWEP